MILDQFETWSRTASAADRADGVKILARACLYSDLGAARSNALRILTEFLDDPSPLVRRTLAETLAGAGQAPHHIIVALADDQSEIAAIVLARSGALTDAELISSASCADEAAQVAIAMRAPVSEAVALALAEIAGPPALIALASNPSAVLAPVAFRRMFERHGDRVELREALLRRGDLPPCLRVDLVAATTRALAAFVAERGWMSDERMRRVTLESRDKAAVTIAGGQADSQGELVAHLRRGGQLTVGLMLRAILCGRSGLFHAAMAELSGIETERVEGLVARCEGPGFAALYRKAGLPDALLPAFRCALRAAAESEFGGGTALHRGAVERTLAGCASVEDGELDKLLVLLRRFETEAAREEARLLGAPARRAARAAKLAEPMLLRDQDEGAAAAARRPGLDKNATLVAIRPAPRRRQLRYEIDMAAIESELLAA